MAPVTPVMRVNADRDGELSLDCDACWATVYIDNGMTIEELLGIQAEHRCQVVS